MVCWAVDVTLTSGQMAEEVFSKVFSKYGLPLRVTSDNDVLFTAMFWRRMMLKLGVKHCTTVVARPQANGMVERRMRTVKEALRAVLCSPGEDNVPKEDWENALDALTFAINTAENEDDAMSAAKQLLGYQPRGVIETMFPLSEEDGRLDAERFKSIRERYLLKEKAIRERVDKGRQEAET